jgi:hypothetical protein
MYVVLEGKFERLIRVKPLELIHITRMIYIHPADSNIPPCVAETPVDWKLRTASHQNKVINHLQLLQLSG